MKRFLSILGAIAFLFIAKVLGRTASAATAGLLVFPILGGLLINWLGKKLIRTEQTLSVLPALSLQTAFYLTFLIAAIVAGSIGGLEIPLRILVFGGGLVWLWTRPGFGPLSLLLAYHLVMSVLFLLNFLDVSEDVLSEDWQAYLGLLLLSVLCAGFNGWGMLRYKASQLENPFSNTSAADVAPEEQSAK